jgi:hypothetical protein
LVDFRLERERFRFAAHRGRGRWFCTARDASQSAAHRRTATDVGGNFDSFRAFFVVIRTIGRRVAIFSTPCIELKGIGVLVLVTAWVRGKYT